VSTLESHDPRRSVGEGVVEIETALPSGADDTGENVVCIGAVQSVIVAAH
jgi:hypothetical protein